MKQKKLKALLENSYKDVSFKYLTELTAEIEQHRVIEYLLQKEGYKNVIKTLTDDKISFCDFLDPEFIFMRNYMFSAYYFLGDKMKGKLETIRAIDYLQELIMILSVILSEIKGFDIEICKRYYKKCFLAFVDSNGGGVYAKNRIN